MQAQDTIILRNGNTIACEIVKIGSDEITYIQPDYEIQFEVDKIKVERVVFKNGMELVIDHREAARETAEVNSADLFLVQHNKVIKMNFSSMLFSTSEFTFEQAVKPGQTYELSFAIIGLGFDTWEQKPRGVGLKAGYKFLVSPDFFIRKMRYAHILKGYYVKPEVAFASYGVDAYSYYDNSGDRQTITKIAFMITTGYQNVFADRFMLDYFCSVGYGAGDEPGWDYAPYYFTGGGEVPLAFATGIRIGILF